MSSTHQQADHPIRPVEAHRVATGARLHFGLFSPGRAAGRSFGGAGMMVDSPGTAITARPAEEFSVRGQEASGIAALADRIAQHFSRPLPLVELAVESRAPRHAGLGSGTQLAMCVAKQLVNAWRTSCDNHTLALAACRGKRSAIGIHGFEQGGFLIDAGKKDNDQIAPLIDRIEFPANWRIVLIDVSDNADGVIPSAKQRQPSFVGVSGADEAEAFDRLPPASLERTETLRREATEVLAPAVRAKNFEDFSQSVTRFNRMAGECFAPVQGGT
ncbi:MAG: hypothetical protein MPJ50_09655, partial [Pirellulales bacterium]|nr:hypothetical protein [Pirellulales bacterium]